MNLQSLSGRYMVSTESAEAPDYALGNPRRVTETAPAPVERWVSTGTSGYERSTTTGAVRKTPEYASAPAVPPWGPCGVAGVEDDGACCVPSLDDVFDAWDAASKRRVHPIQQSMAVDCAALMTCQALGQIPADKRAAVIKALNALEA